MQCICIVTVDETRCPKPKRRLQYSLTATCQLLVTLCHARGWELKPSEEWTDL